MRTALDTILRHDYKNMTRFNASQLHAKLVSQLRLLDAWIRENDDIIDRQKAQLRKLLSEPGVADFPKDGDPYYEAYKLAEGIINALTLDQDLRDAMAASFNISGDRYLEIIDQTKQTEFESNMLQYHKDLMSVVQQNYQLENAKLLDQIAQMRADSQAREDKLLSDFQNREQRLLERIVELTAMLSGARDAKKRHHDGRDEHAPATSQPPAEAEAPLPASSEEDAENGDESTADTLTQEDRKEIKKLAQNKKVAWVCQKYPHWPPGKVAQELGPLFSVSYVTAHRNDSLDE